MPQAGLVRALDAIAALSGDRPGGYRAPVYHLTNGTPTLTADHAEGFRRAGKLRTLAFPAYSGRQTWRRADLRPNQPDFTCPLRAASCQ